MSIPHQVFDRLPRHLPKEGVYDSYGLTFDNVDDLIVIAAAPSINNLTEFSYEAWIRYISYTNFDRVIEKPPKSLQIMTGVILRGYVAAAVTAGETRSVETVPFNQWTLIQMTYDDAGDRIPHTYINAVEVTYAPGYPRAAVGALMADAPNNLIIGNRAAGDRPLNGVYANVRVLNRVLTESERWESLRRGYALHETGCVVCLPMEEGSGGTVYDRSGNGNNGSLGPAWPANVPLWRRNQLYELLVESGQ